MGVALSQKRPRVNVEDGSGMFKTTLISRLVLCRVCIVLLRHVLCDLRFLGAKVLKGTDLAFDPTPMVSHLTLPRLWGRFECEKVAFLAR